MTTAILWFAAIVGGIGVMGYLTFVAIDWFMDAEHRALQMWLDDHARKLKDGEDK